MTRQKSNLISLTTKCCICDGHTTKKYSFGDAYLCNICKDLTINDICIKLQDVIDNILINDPILEFSDEEMFELLGLIIEEDEEEQQGELKE